MGTTKLSAIVEPCQVEFDAYLKCVQSHSQGLKALDCEDIREIYKKCMKSRNEPPAEPTSTPATSK